MGVDAVPLLSHLGRRYALKRVPIVRFYGFASASTTKSCRSIRFNETQRALFRPVFVVLQSETNDQLDKERQLGI